MSLFLMYVIALSGLLPFVFTTAPEPCPLGMFRPEVDGDCKPCSSCPESLFVRETCWENRDTVCGPLNEFLLFKNTNTLKVVHEDATPRRDIEGHSKPEVASDSHDEWHTITMVTIAVLSVSAVLFALFITVTCFKYRRQFKEGLITQIDRDSDFEKADQEMRHPLPGTSGSTTATSSIHTSFRSIEQFEIAEESPS